ncbi:MAG TPA: FliH/SctL family protein [Anaerolineales bacterium]|nr:FliH/SctL family protein [Anaerolineales bacterium]
MKSSVDIRPAHGSNAWQWQELTPGAAPFEEAFAVQSTGLEPLVLANAAALAGAPTSPASCPDSLTAAGTDCALGDLARWSPADLDQRQAQQAERQPVDLPALRAEIFAQAESALRQELHAEAQALIAQAQAQAQTIRSAAEQDAEEHLRQAYERGLQQAQSETQALTNNLTQIVAEARAWRENLLAQSEPLALELVQLIAETLFGQGYILDATTLVQVLKRALSEAKSLGDLYIHLNPDDLAALDEFWPSQQTVLRGQKIELVADEEILRGGCMVEGQFGVVDSRIETQLGLVYETLHTVSRSAPAEAAPFYEALENEDKTA